MITVLSLLQLCYPSSYIKVASRSYYKLSVDIKARFSSDIYYGHIVDILPGDYSHSPVLETAN